MTPKCYICGKFCSYETMDEYTDYGSYGDLEPPEPCFVCVKCSEEEEARIVRETIKPRKFYVPWRPANYHLRAIKQLGMVLASLPLGGYMDCFWSDQVPLDYKIISI